MTAQHNPRIVGADDGIEPLPFVSPKALFDSCSATIQYDLEPWLISRSFTMVSAQPKHGKTYWCAWLASTLSRSGLVCLFVEEEGPPEITRARFEPFIGDELEKHENTLRILHRDGFRLDNPLKVQRLIATAKATGARVIVLDPARSLHGRDESKASGTDGIGDIIETIRYIQRETRCTIVLVHHDRKSKGTRRGGDEQESDDVSGSGAWVAAVDSLIQIRKAPKAEQKPGQFRFYIQNSESRTLPFERRLAVVTFPSDGKPGDMQFLFPASAAMKDWYERIERHVPHDPEWATIEELREATSIGHPKGISKGRVQSAIAWASETKRVVHDPGKGRGVQRAASRTSPLESA